jgi:hypothetical protein
MFASWKINFWELRDSILGLGFATDASKTEHLSPSCSSHRSTQKKPTPGLQSSILDQRAVCALENVLNSRKCSLGHQTGREVAVAASADGKRMVRRELASGLKGRDCAPEAYYLGRKSRRAH